MWNFGECRCAKCVAEEKEMKALDKEKGDVPNAGGEQPVVEGLEQEIRDALGL